MSDEAEDNGGGKKKVSGKKLILLIVLPIVLLVGAGVGVYMSGLLDPLLGIEEEQAEGEETPAEEEPAGEPPGHYLQLDEIRANLRGPGGKTRFLKLQVTLELEDPIHEEAVNQAVPRIKDSFLVFLRELRVEELEGSQGFYRVTEELLNRVNKAVAPIKVRNVLVTDMLIQ